MVGCYTQRAAAAQGRGGKIFAATVCRPEAIVPRWPQYVECFVPGAAGGSHAKGRLASCRLEDAMRHCCVLVWLLVIAGSMPHTAFAAGIDCSRAHSATEKAICASPSLLALDQSVAAAYANHLAQSAAPAEQSRQELLAWLRHRDAACNVPAGSLQQCLTREMTARLAALAPPMPAIAAPTPTPAIAAPTPTPALPTPEPLAPVREVAVPSAANAPQAAATLDASSLPASGEQATLLHVSSPGRFTIQAHSQTGAAIQLVDMLTGPGEVQGSAGGQDGRIDALLDVGTYKVRVSSPPQPVAGTSAVTLAVTAFTDAAPPQALPPPGQVVSATLNDGQQRAFWLAMPQAGELRIEAAGRSLADLQLWRDGRTLVNARVTTAEVTPVRTHALTDLRLVAQVERGTYLAVAYGGAARRWADNDPAQPFTLRAGTSDALAEGWATGTIGPFGSELFTLPATTERVRLELPAAAAAAASLQAGDRVAAIEPTSREPSTTLVVPEGKPHVLELSGAAGQAYRLQALAIPAQQAISTPGTYWVSAVTAGAGGEEVPPSVVLELSGRDVKPARVVAAFEPVLAAGAGWRGRFNLRGRTVMLFQNAAGGEVAVRNTGGQLRSGNGDAYDLPAGYSEVEVAPEAGRQVPVDLVVGPPGLDPPPTPPLPANPVLPLGVQTVAPGQLLTLLPFQAPGVSVGLSARRVPVALAAGPLSATMVAGSSLAVPVAVAPGGTLVVREGGSEPVAYTMQGNTVTIAPANRARTVVLAWRPNPLPPPDIPAPPPVAQGASLAAGQPVFFDLGEHDQRGFALTVPEGGVWRVETLGRLHTTGLLSTAFIPSLGQADGNGAGLNMLLQSVLRAGRYRVTVSALDSSGHLGLSASPAPLLAGAALLPGGSVRASLAAGTAATFPIDIPKAAGSDMVRYHFDVAALQAPWLGRIEDAEGWPLTRTGPLDGTELVLAAGHYRMVVEPDAVSRQVVARLQPIVPAVAITLHGPHPLAFSATANAVWREPSAADQPRTPDQWTFRLDGPATVTIGLGAGMVGELYREGAAAAVTRVSDTATLKLPAGAYRLEATSLGRNDRLAYTASLSSEALQPGVARSVTLPATVEFAIASARVVSVTSFGHVPVKAVLRTADGAVIGRFGARADDWNIAVSQPLAAGAYKLDLAPAVPPDITPTSPPPVPAATDADSDSSVSNNDDALASSDNAQAPSDNAQASSDASQASGDDAQAPEPPPLTTELRLALPPAQDAVPAPTGLAALEQSGVHVLTLPQPGAGSLVVAQAQSSAAVVLTLERQRSDGWQVVAIGQGLRPVIASPADADAAAWRVQVWAVDGGPEPIQAAAFATELPVQAPGAVSLAPLAGGLAVGRVHLPAPGMAAVAGAPVDLLAGGWPGHDLAPVEAGLILPLGQDIWLLARTPASVQVTPDAVAPGQSVTVSLPAGMVATLPALTAAPGTVALWRAESGLGLPGLGAAMGVADGSVLTLANGPVPLRNAAGPDALRVRLTRLEAALLPAQAVGGALQATVPPGKALPLTLPPGSKQILVSLAPGLAAIPSQGAAVWTAGAALSRTITGDWTGLLLVNTGSAPAPAGVALQPAPAAVTLRPGMVVKRFFGADGSLELSVEPAAGAKLVAAGTARLTVITHGGQVTTGSTIALSEPARVVVDAKAGAVAVWEVADGVSPWPAIPAQPAALPARLALSGPAMALAIDPGGPALLRARTTAPVLLALAQAGQAGDPALFPDGAEVSRMVAGATELRLYSPDDGPLSGTLELSAEPVTPVGEGLGAPVTVAPGGAAVFGFTLAKAASIGVGVRATPDQVSVRLLDAATGRRLGEGVAQLQSLPAGAYALEVQVPPGAPTTVVRPAVVGITPRGDGPPPDVVQSYLELVGMKPQGAP